MTKRYKDVAINQLIEDAAEELKNYDAIQPPAWAKFVKTGAFKERPPVRSDWWYVRAAAVLSTAERRPPIGVSKLRTKYGGKKNRGLKPERFYKGSGKILRNVLQQLEKAGLVQQAEKGAHKGRMITSKGISVLTRAAARNKE